MKVFILEWSTPYESAGIVDVFSSREKAEKRKKKIEKECQKYRAEMKRTDYESDMKIPDYLNDDLTIGAYQVW